MSAENYRELAGLCLASALVAFSLCMVLFVASSERRIADGKPSEMDLRRWHRKARRAWGRKEKL